MTELFSLDLFKPILEKLSENYSSRELSKVFNTLNVNIFESKISKESVKTLIKFFYNYLLKNKFNDNLFDYSYSFFSISFFNSSDDSIYSSKKNKLFFLNISQILKNCFDECMKLYSLECKFKKLNDEVFIIDFCFFDDLLCNRYFEGFLYALLNNVFSSFKLIRGKNNYLLSFSKKKIIEENCIDLVVNNTKIRKTDLCLNVSPSGLKELFLEQFSPKVIFFEEYSELKLFNKDDKLLINKILIEKKESLVNLNNKIFIVFSNDNVSNSYFNKNTLGHFFSLDKNSIIIVVKDLLSKKYIVFYLIDVELKRLDINRLLKIYHMLSYFKHKQLNYIFNNQKMIVLKEKKNIESKKEHLKFVLESLGDFSSGDFNRLLLRVLLVFEKIYEFNKIMYFNYNQKNNNFIYFEFSDNCVSNKYFYPKKKSYNLNEPHIFVDLDILRNSKTRVSRKIPKNASFVDFVETINPKLASNLLKKAYLSYKSSEFYDHNIFIQIIYNQNNELIGCFLVFDLNEDVFYKNKETFEIIEQVFSVMMNNHILLNMHRNKAECDLFLNIFNKNRLELDLKHFIDFKENVCVVMFDIDHFKVFNDTYGHLTGDFILKELVNRVKHIIRDDDFFYRFGGEEFILILKNTSIDSTIHLVKRLILSISIPFFNRDVISSYVNNNSQKKYSISCSYGIYLTNFEKDKSVNDVIDKVDSALYFVKEHNRDNFAVYNDEDSIFLGDDYYNYKNKER